MAFQEDRYEKVMRKIRALSDKMAKLNEIESRVSDLEERMLYIENRKYSKKNFVKVEEFGKKIELIGEAFNNYNFIMTPLSEAFSFILSLETMIEGSSPRSDVEIAKFIVEEYGRRGIYYLKSATLAAKLSGRIILERSLKNIIKSFREQGFHRKRPDFMSEIEREINRIEIDEMEDDEDDDEEEG